MGGTSKSESSTQQEMSGTTNPWAPTQGLLNGIIGQLSPQVSNAGPNAQEQGALGTIASNANNAQNYGGQATGLANDLMSGGQDRTGILSGAYGQTQAALSPYLKSNYLDPMQNPGMSGMLDTIKNDVGNSINSQFAGAGRDLSGMNQQSLARGLSQGMSGALLGQYNQNVSAQQGAAGQLSNAAGNTAAGLSGLDQNALANRGLGLDVAINGVPHAQNNQANQILAAQAQARGLPMQNLGMLSSLAIPLAGLGSQTTGKQTGQTQGSQTMSPAQQAWGWMNSGSKLFGAM